MMRPIGRVAYRKWRAVAADKVAALKQNWIETHRELAGHFGKDGEREDESRHELQQLDKVRRENPGLTA